jgi:hypothetical protein
MRRRHTRASTKNNRRANTRSSRTHRVVHGDVHVGTRKVHSRTVNAPKVW